MEPARLLKKYWGYSSFRPLQEDIINSVLAGKDTLTLLPTGGGKSLCYQLPALMMEGMCLVISPLIALMQDQVNRLKELDIPAAAIYAGMHTAEVKRVLENAVNGAYKLLYLSPERLQTDTFRAYLPAMDLSMIAVDEAHCISQWGHDFRPDYLKINSVREVHHKIPILALTATATPEVAADIQAQLALRRPVIFRQSFKKEHLFYEVRYSEHKLSDVPTVIAAHHNASAIIYCRTRKQTELLARRLNQQHMHTAFYHAGLSQEQRNKVFTEWMQDRIKIITATTAFGMGIDKPDVRLVLHADLPEHLEALYQEAGRAGRDGQPSNAVLLYNKDDIQKLEESVSIQFPPEDFLRKVYQSVCEYLQLPIGVQPDRYFHFDLAACCNRFSLPVLQTSYALRVLAQEGLWTLTDQAFRQPTIWFTTDREVLDDINKQYPDSGIVCISILRLYSDVFYYPTPVRLKTIARQAKMKEQEVAEHLRRLQLMGVLEFDEPGEGAQLFFHHLRVDSRHLIIDTRRIALLREKHQKRIAAVINFVLNTEVCRERMLLAYFGEDVKEDCRHCDVCRRKYNSSVTTADLKAIILAKLKEGDMDTGSLINVFPHHEQEKALETLRLLLDDELIHRTASGKLSCI